MVKDSIRYRGRGGGAKLIHIGQENINIERREELCKKQFNIARLQDEYLPQLTNAPA